MLSDQEYRMIFLKRLDQLEADIHNLRAYFNGDEVIMDMQIDEIKSSLNQVGVLFDKYRHSFPFIIKD